ncbi:DUF5107 domain-containing protein [Rhizobium tubonense]|uniref:DUF5107 domain-containing protein n=1 Tax=Rhizobium tubonense TaxID=484088 RepID=A0A2W4CLE5_9HYPH|nr:DUF5107 domain-containing protein [Rhizobium tubonense]PZM11265.1 hypothetical protein CPY51_21140 [Rhizobium tubonense]
MTVIEMASLKLPSSRLGEPDKLPTFHWQQPIPVNSTPENRGLSDEESAHGFQWGDSSILPYRVLNDYDRSQRPGTLEAIRIENDHLRLSVLPKHGGRVFEFYDKRLERDLVFRNPVFQPANLAALGAWFSGGIEWNGLIPGHTPFSCAPVFAERLETERGPILRLFEFDRVIEAAWQIDLFLPPDGDQVYVHGRIVNPDSHEKLAYWWTNVAVPMSSGLRVLSPADYSIEHVLPGNELARFDFPHGHGFDGSYPENWQNATSVFFRKPQADRRWIAALDASGVGLAQTSTRELRGRKFFYFGEASGGQHWMDFLSLDGEGRYLEIQSGITPTQNQRFVLPASGIVEFTECFASLVGDAHDVHQADYASACAATARLVERRFDEADFADVDAFLRKVASTPGKRLQSGSAWGMRHERLTGKAIAKGLNFDVEAPVSPWDELASGSGSSQKSLEAIPDDFVVSPRWCAALCESAESQGQTWLHSLVLGIAALDDDRYEEARALFSQSIAIKPTWLGERNLALLADDQIAEEHYRRAWALPGAPPSLAVEIVEFLQRLERFNALNAFIRTLPAPVLTQERIEIARAILALRQSDFDTLQTILERQFATIREGETTLDELWQGLQIGLAMERLERELSGEEAAAVLRSNPLPKHLDFRMLAASQPASSNKDQNDNHG